MKDKVRVLFVCTGNVFRSMTAEYCMKDYLRKHDIEWIEAGSAGTIAYQEGIHPEVMRALMKRGIDVSGHEQRKLSAEILEHYDIIISMAKEHVDYIRDHFGINSILFNEIVKGERSSLPDIDEVIDDLNDEKRIAMYIDSVIDYICSHIAEVVEYVRRYGLKR